MKRILLCLTLLLIACCEKKVKPSSVLVEGVSKELGISRKNQISNVQYHLSFKIPEAKEDSIAAKLLLELTIHDLDQALILDFKSDQKIPEASVVNGKKLPLDFDKEHLIIPVESLVLGNNKIEIEFIAGEMSLNRNDDYLYTLLVPDRARTLFPCFDQPDIKASYQLNITAPKNWKVLCGSPQTESIEKGDFIEYRYKESDKMSTYLFSFVAGKFDVAESKTTALPMSIYHQEKDSSKIQLSTSKIFNLHQQAVNYLEDYTGHAFPFQKLDYAAIYSHPYGGMEHTGAVQYRQSLLFLGESATLNQKLGRAKLIAHETAHMWFGNLVTMKWFNDVWLKEVFANFMADKIVNPEFKSVNHELSFFIDHYPAAYTVDRSKGANPIRQNLDNLNNAGSLYGSIIYHKAPIMMGQLEALVGEDNFREGIKEYIQLYQNDNANWNDLISILDKKTEIDLIKWSNVWVNSPGRPTITSEILYDEANKIKSFFIEQQAEDKSENIWPQVFNISLIYSDTTQIIEVGLTDKKIRLLGAEDLTKPDFIVYNSNGKGYGTFPLSKEVMELVPNIKDEISRASIYLNAYEKALNGKVSIDQSLDIFQQGLVVEKNELVLSLLTDQIEHLFWMYLSEEEREERQNKIENILFSRLLAQEEASIKKTLFNSYLSLAYTGIAKDKLYEIWHKDLTISDLLLNQDDQTRIAMYLALYEHEKAKDILQEARTAIKDSNKLKRFNFLLPALSPEEVVRNSYFKSFRNLEMREKENWVLAASYYIHHPLRQKTAIESLKLSLTLLEEIQQTGDIFFPKGWLNSTIGLYSSYAAYSMVRGFLDANPDLNPQLRLKVLQATDDLFRLHQTSEPVSPE